MIQFKSSDKLAKLIHVNHYLLPVINRFGIRLGFKDKTVDEVCNEKGMDVNFFLAIVNTFSNKDYFPAESLLSFSPELMIDYLRKTHKYYFDYMLPELERRLLVLLGSCKDNCGDLNLVKKFYDTYKIELKKHVDEEEEHVYPYILKVVELYNSKQTIKELDSEYRIGFYEKNHTDIDQKLYDLKNIIIKYLEPIYNDNDCNSFLYALFQLERDIIDHARIEDKVLVTKVKELETIIGHG